MKKFDLKSGLSVGVGMSVFFILNDLLTTDILTFKSVGKIVTVGIISGSITGFLFGLFVGLFKS